MACAAQCREASSALAALRRSDKKVQATLEGLSEQAARHGATAASARLALEQAVANHSEAQRWSTVARREQEALDTMKLELGIRRRAVERQRHHASLDPAARAAMEHGLAEMEAAFLKATARAKKAAQAAMLAQSEEDRQRVEQAVRDAAKRTVSRSASSMEIFRSVSGGTAERRFGGRHGLESAMARFAAQADGRWP